MVKDEKDVKELTEEKTDKVTGGSNVNFDIEEHNKQYEHNIYPQGDPKDKDFINNNNK